MNKIYKVVGNTKKFFSFKSNRNLRQSNLFYFSKIGDQSQKQQINRIQEGKQLQETISEEERELDEYLKEKEKNYEIVDKKYEEVSVPGTQSRKYTGLNKLQQEIIETNTFDLSHPDIKPKNTGINRYQGVEQDLMEINLGNVKIKGQNEVYLSEIDPEEIPEDLDILFDQEKTLKVIGKSQDQPQSNRQAQTQQPESSQQTMMSIQKDTIQKKSLQETLKEEIGINVQDAAYSKRERARQMMLSILMVFIIWPLQDTLGQVYDCLSLISEIEEEKMAEVTRIKENNFRRVLLINHGIIDRKQTQ